MFKIINPLKIATERAPITESQFWDMAGSSVVAAADTPVHAKILGETLFKAIDANDDGLITADELADLAAIERAVNGTLVNPAYTRDISKALGLRFGKDDAALIAATVVGIATAPLVTIAALAAGGAYYVFGASRP